MVLRDGRVEQAGTPLQLYNKPANRFVAGFIGSPKMNFLNARVSDPGAGGRCLLAVDGGGEVEMDLGIAAGKDVVEIGSGPSMWNLPTLVCRWLFRCVSSWVETQCCMARLTEDNQWSSCRLSAKAR